MDIPKELIREHLLADAKKETANLKAMKIIMKADDDPVMVLKLNDGLSHGFSSSQKELFLKSIDLEIKEIQKAVNQKPNKWE